MGDLKMTCPSSVRSPWRSTATIQRHLWEFEPPGPYHARAEPRGGARSSMVFATASCSEIEPHISAPSSVVVWAQPSGSADGDRRTVDTSRFVLIVDDDPDLLDVTTFVIEGEGMAVETARNGQEALALLGAGRLPAVVLLDLMMPVMNGWEFLAAIANDPLLKGIPVVVLTAAEHQEVPGAAAVLSKPMDLKDLLRVVERYSRGAKDAGA